MAVGYSSFVKIHADFGGGSGNISATVPSGLTTDDTWIVWGVDDNNGSDGAISAPTGFTAIDAGHRTGGGFPFQRGFWKTAGASESAVNLPFGSGTYGCTGYSVRLTGADTTNPIGNITTTAASAAATTIAVTAVTIQNNASLALSLAAGYRSASVVTMTAPATMTRISYENTNDYQHSGIGYELVDAGSYSPGNWTYSGSSQNRTCTTVEILPAAGAGGTTYNDSLTESLTLAETVDSVLTTAGTASETLTLAETVAAALTTAGTASEALTLAESASSLGVFASTRSEALTLSESGVGNVTQSATLSEALALSETPIGGLLVLGDLTEALSLSETTAGALAITFSLTEALTLTESQSGLLVMGMTVGESLALAETDALAASVYGASLTESLALAETLSASLITSGSVAEALSLAEGQSGDITTGTIGPCPVTYLGTPVTYGGVEVTSGTCDIGGGGGSGIFSVGGKDVKARFVPVTVVTTEGHLPRQTDD